MGIRAGLTMQKKVGGKACLNYGLTFWPSGTRFWTMIFIAVLFPVPERRQHKVCAHQSLGPWNFPGFVKQSLLAAG